MKRTTKKIIFIAITIILAIVMQSIVVTKQVKAEVKSGDIKNMKWSFDTSTGELTVSGKTEAYRDFYKNLDFTAKDVKVLKVGKDVEYLKFNSDGGVNITTIELENEKTDISSESAVYYMNNLTTVKHGENIVEKYDASTKTLTISGKGKVYAAFLPHVSKIEIENIKIEDGITDIQTKLGSNKLKNVSLPNSLISMGNYQFEGASNLENIELPTNLKNIGTQAFDSCKKLKKISLPDSVEEIGMKCFESCSELEEVKLSSKLEEIPTDCFSYCDSLKEVTLPKNIKKMAPSAFYECKNLTKLTIENEECKSGGFMEGSNIKNLTYLKMGNIEYKFDKDNGILEVSGSKKIITTEVPTMAFGKSLIKTLIIKDGIEEIGDECFSSLSKVEKIELPNSLKVIGKKSFQKLESLTEITLSDNIEKIGEDSFKDCEKLTITTEDGSAAHKYAEENDIDVEVTKGIIKGISGAMLPIIIGCAVGGVLFIVIVVVVIVVIVKKKNKKQ